MVQSAVVIEPQALIKDLSPILQMLVLDVIATWTPKSVSDTHTHDYCKPLRMYTEV